jgi:hypothetical protein
MGVSSFGGRVAAIRGRGRHRVRGAPPPVGGGYMPSADIERDKYDQAIDIGVRADERRRATSPKRSTNSSPARGDCARRGSPTRSSSPAARKARVARVSSLVLVH